MNEEEDNKKINTEGKNKKKRMREFKPDEEWF